MTQDTDTDTDPRLLTQESYQYVLVLLRLLVVDLVNHDLGYWIFIFVALIFVDPVGGECRWVREGEIEGRERLGVSDMGWILW